MKTSLLLCSLFALLLTNCHGHFQSVYVETGHPRYQAPPPVVTHHIHNCACGCPSHLGVHFNGCRHWPHAPHHHRRNPVHVDVDIHR
jgi:hypothetical protein